MGVHAMVKSALKQIRRNNSTNPRVAMEWNSRVTSIAKDVETSRDVNKERLLQGIVSTVAEEFNVSTSADDITARLDPGKFKRRQEALLEADERLDALKAPGPLRRSTMARAAAKDFEAIKEDIEGLCQETALNLQKLCDILPTRQDMRDQHEEASSYQSRSFMELQTMMARVHSRLASMEQHGLIDANLPVVVFHLEDPNGTEPIPLVIPLEYTFADLADDLLKADPGLLLPDFWVKKTDSNFNRVTQSNLCWEYQSPRSKVCEVPVLNDGTDRRTVDIVVGKDSYIVVLINHDGVERGKVVELPIARNCTSIHLANVFRNYKISKILDLREGTDASGKLFNKYHFTPNTNTLYVELESVQPSQGVTTTRTDAALVATAGLFNLFGHRYSGISVTRVATQMYFTWNRQLFLCWLTIDLMKSQIR